MRREGLTKVAAFAGKACAFEERTHLAVSHLFPQAGPYSGR